LLVLRERPCQDEECRERHGRRHDRRCDLRAALSPSALISTPVIEELKPAE
jgi:hypothetical protein